jgi:hypothetical protein
MFSTVIEGTRIVAVGPEALAASVNVLSPAVNVTVS